MTTQAKVLNIMALALEVTGNGLADVFVTYSGHVNTLDVKVYPQGHDYQDLDKAQITLLDLNFIELSQDTAGATLDSIITYLESLQSAEKAQKAA